MNQITREIDPVLDALTAGGRIQENLTAKVAKNRRQGRKEKHW